MNRKKDIDVAKDKSLTKISTEKAKTETTFISYRKPAIYIYIKLGENGAEYQKVENRRIVYKCEEL